MTLSPFVEGGLSPFIEKAAIRHNVPALLIEGYSRKPDIVRARHSAWKAAYASGMTRQEIAREAGRHWTTINNAVKQ